LLYQPLPVQRSPPAQVPIGLLAAAVRSGVRQLVERRAAPLGLSTQQFWFVVAIAERRHGAQCELAARLRVDAAVTSRIVRTLVSRGLVRAVRDEADRRRVHLALTPAGERMAARLLPVAREVRAAVDAPLSEAERSAARAALLKIVSHLRSLAEATAGRSSPVEVSREQARTRRGARRAAPARRVSQGG
jgi:DNA-binding MarR family transcriptional regulator